MEEKEPGEEKAAEEVEKPEAPSQEFKNWRNDEDLTVIDTPWYTTFWSSSQWTSWRHTKVYVIAAIRNITAISMKHINIDPGFIMLYLCDSIYTAQTAWKVQFVVRVVHDL